MRQRTFEGKGLWLVTVTSLSLCSCKGTEPPAQQSLPQQSSPKIETASKAPEPPAMKAAQEDKLLAAIGKPAPDFALLDLEGKEVRLSSFVGKPVVLEWFNPSCPFVKAAHTEGSLVDAAARLTEKGVVYLGINSGAVGKQGHGKEVNQAGKETFKLAHPILLDESGEVGHLYGATNTPHIFVVDESGILVYRGAVDNSPDGEGKSPEGGVLVSYLDQAVQAVLAKKPVSAPETKAYGCSVKYAR